MTPQQFYQETDRCVKCGLCLPHCPTYLRLADEADSPRGRITLIQAYTSRQIPLSSELQSHLDRCLGCRACERICPSGVRYGTLIDATREWIRIERKAPPSGLNPWLLSIYSDRKRLRKYTRPLPLLRRSGLLKLAHRLAPAKYRSLLQVATLLPEQVSPPGIHPTRHPPRGQTLQLFIGCVSSLADQPAIDAAIKVLSQLGYAVDIPSKQVCCGALHRHNGYPDIANHLCDQNRKQTENSRALASITLATACHLELNEHEASHIPVVNVIDFLIDNIPPIPHKAIFTAASHRVAVHTPCSARNDQTLKLLRMIPSLEVMELPDNDICCGSAGSYLITQPELSRQFGQDKLKHLKTTAPDILVTSNTGCAIQFRILIEQAKLDIEVLHPIELINRHLRLIT
ncbi:MAG: (Fe-S)-binding protein [Chromatiales bacterium]